jgi:pseudaminic acid biosynthesis-associated methylase
MTAEFNTEQERFWADTYARDYIEKNKTFDNALGVEAWKIMLRKAEGIRSLLECGCNIGRNMTFLDQIMPEAKKSIIEISKPAFDFVARQHRLAGAFNGPILESDFPAQSFDLVFTMGVLIHISPDQLLDNMEKMYEYSRKYVLIGEYFNRTPVMLEYQGQRDKLFKRDFGKLFIESHDVRLVEYGFLWGHLYDSAGFDDITWWLFEKG